MAICVLLGSTARPASAQQSLTDVLTFLLTNRSIPTADFVRDEQAAVETRDTVARFLILDLATLPVSPSSGGFTYRFDPALGTVVRSSDSFGPFFTERSLTSGRARASFGFGYRSTTFDSIDGRDLRDGTLVSTASILRGESAPFDIETVTLRIRTDTMTLTGNYGVTDRLDIGGAIPVVRVNLQGQRVDTYRGRELVQATGSASASGLGDVVVRAKYSLLRAGGSGLALAGEASLPTGSEEDLLGTGRMSLTPRLVGSDERDRVGMHGELGYSFREVSNSLGYALAVTVVAVPRLTLVGELSGLRLGAVRRRRFRAHDRPPERSAGQRLTSPLNPIRTCGPTFSIPRNTVGGSSLKAAKSSRVLPSICTPLSDGVSVIGNVTGWLTPVMVTVPEACGWPPARSYFSSR